MIYGIGTDLCDVRRVRASIERRGQRFIEKILTEREIEVWRRRVARWPDRGVRYVATRFSAKEAFSKAVGLGLHEPMRWRWCAILNRPGGQPEIVLSGALKSWFEERHLLAHVSLSDETDYVSSFCVVERVDHASRG